MISIESRWGALGTLVLLQCYGLLLAYFFAGAMRHAASLSSLFDLPGRLVELGAGLAFLSIFIHAQGKLLADVMRYLGRARDIPGWLREAGRPHGVLRILITAAVFAFYAALLSGRITLGYPDVSLLLLLGYQVFHPLASYLVGQHLRRTRYPTETRYVSAAEQVLGVLMCMVAAAVFYGFGLWMKRDYEPAYWIFQMMGSGVAVFGLALFLLEDIRGRYKEVFANEEEAR